LNAAFALRDVTIGYGGRPVLSVSGLTISDGERVAVVGRSGAGKSSLLRYLHGLAPGRVALIPQDGALVRALSVFHNIYMGQLDRHPLWYNLWTLVRPGRAEVAGVRRIAAALGLEDKLFEPVETLSGGQQQRTAVGRALFNGGDIVLGDEPVSAVDPHQARSVLAALAEVHHTVVLAMHDVELALAFSDRIIGLCDGAVVLDLPSAGLTPEALAPLYRS